MGKAEELGTGIGKVYKYIRAYTGNDLVTFEEDDLFRVHISLGSLFPDPNISGTLSGTLNEGQQKVFDFLIQHSGVQAKEIIEQLNISRRNILMSYSLCQIFTGYIHCF